MEDDEGCQHCLDGDEAAVCPECGNYICDDCYQYYKGQSTKRFCPVNDIPW